MTTLRGRVVTPDGLLPDAVVEVEGDRITAVRGARPDDTVEPSDDLLLPGLVDVHCHGGGGAAFTVPDRAEVATAAAHHLGQGTTSLVASAVTDDPERMLAVVATLADAVEAGEVAAIHLEGPFLSAARCGAQDPTRMLPPDLGLAAALLEAGRGHVRVMTIAPELPGADDLADLLAERGVQVAVGHTDATATATERFLRDRAPALVTHLFNGMAPLHHRAPGAALGALAAASRGAATVELIADGVHLSDETVAGVFALLGGPRVVLVSDAMAAAGLGDGEHQLGPLATRVTDGVARLVDGGSIAGGTSGLLDVVGRQVAAGLDPVEVVASASHRPAALLGIDGEVGAIGPGLRADLVVLDPDWRLRRVMRAGGWVP
jgi:N-acetylglucosamine-6-phosphate deacetylase